MGGAGGGARAAGVRAGGTSGGLDRDAILCAALALVDAEGAQAVSMRRVADALGVTPMALYHHVADKRALLDGVADLVMRELALPTPRTRWDRRLRRTLLAVRGAYRAHPHAAPLIQTTRAVTPALLAPMETALGALRDAGLSPAAARAAWIALIGLTNGMAAYETSGHAREADHARAYRRALDALIAGLVGSWPAQPAAPDGRLRS